MNQLYRCIAVMVLICLAHAAGAEEPILVIEPQGHSAMIKEVIFTPDGKTLISVSNDKTIRLWDVETGNLLNTLRGQIGEGPEGKLFAAALSPDGITLAVGGYIQDDEIRVFNLASGEQLGILKGHTKVVHALAFSPDSKRLASGSGDKTVRIWDISKIPLLGGARGGSNSSLFTSETLAVLEDHTDAVYSVAFSPDSTKLVSASFDGMLRLWDVTPHPDSFSKGARELKVMKQHTAEVRCVAFAPNGKYIVSGGLDGKILLWDGNGKFINEIDDVGKDVYTVSFSTDSTKVLVSGLSGKITSVYTIPSGEKLTTFNEHDNTVVASAFYGKNLIATAGFENDIYLWDANSGETKTHIVGKGQTVWAAAFRSKQAQGVRLTVAFGNTSNYTTDSNRGPIEKSFNFLKMSLNPNSPDERLFRRIQTEYQGNTLEKMNDYELRITNGGTIENHRDYDGWIRIYTFISEGNVIIGSSFSLKLYTSDGTFIREFKGHTGEIWAVSVSPEGRILASASNDQTIKLWNIETGECLATLFVASDNEWVCWTPQGYYAASAGGEKYIGWHINQGIDKAALFYSVSVFREQYFQPELVKRTIELGSFEEAFAEFQAQPEQADFVERSVRDILPPVIEWLAPTDISFEHTASSIRVHAKIRSQSELADIKFLVNGRPQFTSRDVRIRHSSPYYWEMDDEIPLVPGRNEISIYAKNVNSGVASDKRIIMYRVKDVKPNLYLVAIGISDYELNDVRLRYADDDAKAISRLFRSQQGKMYAQVEVQELYDADATYDKILDALDWLKERPATPKDVVAIFIAAHGLNHEGKYYLFPADGNPQKLHRTAVDWHDFFEVLGTLRARVLLFLDTCHSGQIGVNALRLPNTEAIRTLSSDEYGVVILAASTGAETSKEDEAWEHGAFTKALLEGLEEGQADNPRRPDGIIDLRELDLYVAYRVEELTNMQQHPTTQKPSTISRFPIVQIE